MPIDCLFLMFNQLAVEFVRQHIDGGVQIFHLRVGKQLTTTDMYCRLSLLNFQSAVQDGFQRFQE